LAEETYPAWHAVQLGAALALKVPAEHMKHVELEKVRSAADPAWHSSQAEDCGLETKPVRHTVQLMDFV
jgi:hypothetical protein